VFYLVKYSYTPPTPSAHRTPAGCSAVLMKTRYICQTVINLNDLNFSIRAVEGRNWGDWYLSMTELSRYTSLLRLSDIYITSRRICIQFNINIFKLPYANRNRKYVIPVPVPYVKSKILRIPVLGTAIVNVLKRCSIVVANIFDKLEPEPHKNRPAPQHC
jgi:hypothetical protein